MLQTRIDNIVAEAPRYRAFLSYCHVDETHASRLHEALETYRLPRRLRAAAPAAEARPLYPIFRDRAEFSAEADLSAAIVEALHDSAAMIVLCSPACTRSEWVAQEIALFRDIHPAAPVLAVIVAGEPFASDSPARAAEECLPAALRIGPANERREPLAADLRPGKDGERLATLKIVAGIVGLRLDDLVRRDAERSQRRWRQLAAGAALIAAVLAVSLALALVARRDADKRRAQAEGLVEFMVADLGEKLAPVGRLSLLDAVYSRALRYYSEQDTGALDPDALARRARVLQMTGEVRSQQGKFDQAYLHFQQAAASTGELLRRFPNDGQRIFDHAQSVFYVGQADWRRGRTDDARRAFEEYRRLAKQLIALDPANETWRAELGYAESNLGTLLFDQGRTSEAARAFAAALNVAGELSKASPKRRDLQISWAQSHGWVGNTAAQGGNLARAIAEREAEIAIYDRLLAADRTDREVLHLRIIAEGVLGGFIAKNGNIQTGLARSAAAAADAVALSRADPQNMDWNALAAQALLNLGDAERDSGAITAAKATLIHADRRIARLSAAGDSIRNWDRLRIQALLAAAELALARNERILAERYARQTLTQIELTMHSTPENASFRELARHATRVIAQIKNE